jgi:hypothetical protein
VVDQIWFDVFDQFRHSSWVFKFNFSQTKSGRVWAGERSGQVGAAGVGASYTN